MSLWLVSAYIVLYKPCQESHANSYPGAGPAGLVVADRMSEAGKKTLLLEQGGPSYYFTGGRKRPGWLNGTELSRVDVPGLYKSIFASADNLTCSPDIYNSFGACTIGGNTAINAGLFFQPPASDFDLYFPEGWKSEDVQSAIEKVRTKQPYTDRPSQDGKFYLQSGYEAAKQWLVEGAGFEQVDINEDADDKTKVWGRPLFNYEGGQRSGPTKTYLTTALNRENFSFISGAKVTRVVRDGETATGVDVLINGTTTTFSICGTSGQVILSGGALFSPQLLMLSGIGDPAVLANLSANSILKLSPDEWINNTAVGDKLFDNPNTFIELFSSSISSYTHSYDNPPLEDAQLYLNNRSGPYSFASQTSAFWDTITTGNDSIGCQGTIDSSGFGEFTENGTITLNVYGTSGLHSLGKVVLDERGVPGASSFFYSDPRDSKAIATFIHNIFGSLSKSSLTVLNLPGNSTLDQIEKYITTPSQYTIGNVLHWSSSCRIGTCVDGEARVKGMQNLYVVDASIVEPLSVNPTFGIMVVAERAVELILGSEEDD